MLNAQSKFAKCWRGSSGRSTVKSGAGPVAGISPQARMPPSARSAPRGGRLGLLVLTAGPGGRPYASPIAGGGFIRARDRPSDGLTPDLASGAVAQSECPQTNVYRTCSRGASVGCWLAEPGVARVGYEGAAAMGHRLPGQRYSGRGVTGVSRPKGAAASVMGATSAMRSASMLRRRRRVAPRTRRPSALKAS